nr:MAG TPA: hypothetical protein [Caudoviricetes sp.]
MEIRLELAKRKAPPQKSRSALRPLPIIFVG